MVLEVESRVLFACPRCGTACSIWLAPVAPPPWSVDLCAWCGWLWVMGGYPPRGDAAAKWPPGEPLLPIV